MDRKDHTPDDRQGPDGTREVAAGKPADTLQDGGAGAAHTHCKHWQLPGLRS